MDTTLYIYIKSIYALLHTDHHNNQKRGVCIIVHTYKYYFEYIYTCILFNGYLTIYWTKDYLLK